MKSKLKILVNIDDDISREGILQILQLYPELDMVVAIPFGENPIDAVERIQPQIFVTSIEGKIMDGISATKLITAKFPNVSVLAISTFQYDSHLVDIVQAGAKGCLVRDIEKEELLCAIRTMHANGLYYCSRIEGIIAHLIRTDYFANFKGPNPIHNLTPKDRQFLKLLCEQRSMKEISYEMEIDIRSLDWRKRKLLELLGQRNVVGLAFFCVEYGMFNPHNYQRKIAV